MSFQFGKHTRGQATLLIVTVLCVVGTIVFMSSLDVFVRDYSHKAKDFNQVLLDETTSSAFAVMETALERRLWEPPPDENCLRSENMEVTGSTPDDVTWKVTAHFNFATKNFEMTATGEYKELTSIFKKKIKVMDVSDYLLLSTNENPIFLQRLYSTKVPTALIARDRRIYTRGPLLMGSSIHRTYSMTDFSGSAGSWPADWGTIVQGDRMQFGGGIRYLEYSVPKPNDPALQPILAPFSSALVDPPTHHSQWGGGSTVITKDFDKANNLQEMVKTGATGPVTKASVAAEVYPIALFNGTPPLKAWTAADNGTFFNDVDRQSIFYYGWGETNNFGVRFDGTCFSLVNPKKFCSHSEHFPRGFNAWRTAAGLDGYLFTADAVAVPSPTIGWDNLKALEDDARTCGAVITAPINPYVDCPVWDKNFIEKYATGDNSGCRPISKINLDTVPFAAMNVAVLNDPANSGRLLRRILYVKGPATLVQDQAAGLMLSTIPNNTARKNLSIWVVSEDLISLQGFQADTTSPLDSNPGTLREVVFNGDASGVPLASQKEPLALTMMTTERVNLLSPFHTPMTLSHLSKIWPVSGGKIRPIRHNMTDWERQENDGFKYGYRRYILHGINVVSSAQTSSGEPFFLQGLWSAPDSSASQFPSNQCMVSKSGSTLQPNGATAVVHSALIPGYQSDPNGPIPPIGSRYYPNATNFPTNYVPNVFWVQRASLEASREQSEIILNGITMSTNFSSEAPTGFRNLNIPLHKGLENRTPNLPFDLSHKNFEWDSTNYYKTKPAGTACTLNNIEFKQASAAGQEYDPYGVQPSTNNGRQVFVQTAPATDYRNVGSVVGIDQLVIETKADPSAPSP